MHCPKCLHEDTKVLDTRESTPSTIRRRRQCLKCGYRFTTLEEILREELWVIKRDGSREAFDRNKIVVGINKAAEKRPISTHTIEKMVSEIVEELQKQHEGDIPCKSIGEFVMLKLKSIDPITYVRFASVYKDFRDLSDWTKEINSLNSLE
ncbi:MAG: transcriptional regulator NrdR [Verrucomicrobia bacterium GWC2_42_7]|nr:MAG: transcriptional regulator NrdR [Verrucomicrobia bacterium GWC2_42_7]